MTRMYITAAPVGAVPKWLDPLEPTFIPAYLLHHLLEPARAAELIGQLQADGWETVDAGGLLIEEGHDHFICDDLFGQLANQTQARRAMREAGWTRCQQGWCAPKAPSFSVAVIPREWMTEVSSIEFVRRFVLQLTTYGWTASDRGDLVWHHAKLHSYLPPALVNAMRKDCPGLLARLHEAGWRAREAGYWQAGKGRSPFLPITPVAIAAETIRSMKEGAAVVHLHTRELSDRTRLEIPGLGTITTGAQRNQIKVDHYDLIVPAVKHADPTAILNLSTSVRGDRHGAHDNLRRAHLKSYAEVDGPEIASLSPAAVIFQGGGGYDNAPDFLAAQFEHFRRVGTRPEVEVFNHTIVDNATTLYRGILESVGQPVLFMLVAGVDQYFRDPISGEVEDDSLIAPAVRQDIVTHLSSLDEQGRQRAVDLAVSQLRPVVDRLRQSFPFSLISLLLPGPLQTLLADVAQALRLDGVRIGLEDGLNVIDRRVPGGVRKALGTWEQVRMLRNELLARGITIQTSTEVRDMLGMPLAASVSPHLKRA